MSVRISASPRQPSAPPNDVPLADEQCVRTRLRRGNRRAEPGDAAAHDQNIDGRRQLLVTIRIRPIAGLAPTRHAADGGLEHLPTRPLEGLVIEACGYQRRKCPGRRAQIEADAGPAIHAHCIQVFDEFDHGGAHVRRTPCPGSHIDKSRRLLDAAGENSARPVQLETAAHELHAVGEQRGCQCVPREAAQSLAVEAKLDAR